MAPTDRQFKIRPLQSSDLGAVARIHCDAFPSSALNCFGEEAVREYYDWQMRSLPKLIGYVAAEGDRVCGYAYCGDTFLSPVPFLVKKPKLVGIAILSRPSFILDRRLSRIAVYAARSAMKRIFAGKTSGKSLKTPTVASFWLEAVAVERGAQGNGVGASLVRRCVENGFSQGFDAIYLAVEPMNHRAIAIYEKLGWSRVTNNGRWSGRMKLTSHSGTALETAC